MNEIYKHYNIPSVIIEIIQDYYLEWRESFKQCIMSIEKGTHTCIKYDDKTKVDLFRLMINKYKMLYVPLTLPYEGPNFISNSSPIFHCKRCNRYHNIIFGYKICSTYGV